MSRGSDLAPMAARFLSTMLTDDGMVAFAAALDERLTPPGASLDLAACKVILDGHPEWISGPSKPQMPGFATLQRDRSQRRRRSA